MIGSTIGSYRILSELGEGGMGVVYRAQEILLDREVALKALHPQITRDESRLQRFKSEAKALARLHHPNIATLFNFFEQDGVFYMVMEFVDGQTLEDVTRQNGALPLRGALEIFNSALRGFEHAHARGVIHRDIKPSNLMLTDEGEVKITDFGIARVAGGGKLTQTGKLIGTLEYMSPEQVQGQEQDARSDIYSLGILLFELVTGKMPWSVTSDFDIMRAHLEVPAPPARSLISELPPALDVVITRALNKKPDERFQTVGEMRAELEKIVNELPASQSAVFPLIKPTRVADAPTMDAATAEPRGLVGAGTNGETRVPPVNAGGAKSNFAQKKWFLPAIAGGAASLLLIGFLALAARKPAIVPDAAPTAMPAVIDAMETPTPAPTAEPTALPVPAGGAGDLPQIPPHNSNDDNATGIQIPQDLPGLTTPVATPKPTAKPRPTEKPRTQSVVKSKPRPVVRSRPRPKPRPKPVVRSRPKPKPRPRPVVRSRPKPRPRPRPKSNGSSEKERLRNLFKNS